MPAVRARIQSSAQPSRAPRQTPQVRLVSDRSKQYERTAQRNAVASAYQTTFYYLAVAVGLLVFLGLGGVFINAEATRCSQQSALIQADITRATARAQSLELDYATLRNSSRIEKIATKEMGMVAAGNKVSAIDIGKEVASVAQKPAAPSQHKALTRLAQLTTGEASALLVGDINLALSR